MSTPWHAEPATEAGTDGWARRRARISHHIERCAIQLLVEAGDAPVTAEQIAAASPASRGPRSEPGGTALLPALMEESFDVLADLNRQPSRPVRRRRV